LKRAHHHAVYAQEMLDRLEIISRELLEKWDCQLSEFGGESDHVHLLISAHPSLELSKLINNLKTVTSRAIRKEFEEHLKLFYWKPVLWTRAYYIASAGGAPLEVIKEYIENQGKEK
jgi:putative transposase